MKHWQDHLARKLPTVVLFAAAAALGWSEPSQGACLLPPGDLTATGTASVQDVQCSILSVLWSLDGHFGPAPSCIKQPGSPSLVADHNCDSVISVVDVQVGIQFALGIPLSAVLDANGNQCVDACELDTDGDGDPDWLDCAPINPGIHATAVETCNGWDDDCDGVIDPANDPSVAVSCQNGDVCDGTELCPPPALPSGIIWSEYLLESSHGPAGEWIELFNGSNVPINIRGWRLARAIGGPSHTIEPGGALFVPARGHLTLGFTKTPELNGGAPVAYAYGPFNLAGASTLILRDASGALVEAVNLSGLPATAGSSTARITPASAPGMASSWAVSTLPYDAENRGTPTGPNIDVAPASCLPGNPLVCAANGTCEAAMCDPVAGCATAPLPNCCGNGTAEPGEACDGADLAGQSCQSLGFSGGTLSCLPNCSISTSNCTTVSTCDPVSPPNYFGNSVGYTCSSLFGFPVVSFSTTTWTFSAASPTQLRVTVPNGSIPPMLGPMPTCPSGSFSVTGVIAGGCCERYTLSGTYSSANTFTGTFSVSFCGSAACGCPTGDGISCLLATCSNQTYPVSASR